MMQLYYWQAKDSDNHIHYGHLYAFDAGEIAQMLVAKELQLLALKRSRLTKLYLQLNPIRSAQICRLTQQLAHLLKANIALSDALTLLNMNSYTLPVQGLIHHLQQQIHQGHPLSQALPSPPFNALYRESVANGELTGELDSALTTLGEQLEQKAQLAKQIKAALIYPTLLVFVASLVCYVMIAWVIPEFEQLFVGLAAPLPLFTQMVIDVANHIRQSSFVILISLLSLIVSITFSYHSHSQCRYYLSVIAYHTPVLASLITQIFMARFSQTLFYHLRAGIPLSHALTRCAQTALTPYHQVKLSQVSQSIQQGHSIYHAMKQSQLFSPATLQLILIGEESGRLDTTFAQLYTLHHQALTEQLTRLKQVIEPCCIMLLGGVIACLVIAMYLPIFSLTNVLG